MTLQLFDPLEEQFLEFHHGHPEVLDDLVSILRQCREAGARQVSLRDAFGALRLDRQRRGLDVQGFALNNSYASRYARLIAALHPDLGSLLRTRSLKNQRES